MERKFLNYNNYLELKEMICDDSDQIIISFINPYSYFNFYNDRKLFNNFSGFFVDGGLLCRLNNLFFKRKVERISFDYSSIADDFFLFCQKNKLSVSIIASTDEELFKAVDIFKFKYPELKIGYSRNGFVSISEMEPLIKSLTESDVIIIGMGAPIQEKFAISLKGKVPAKLIITCGGFITQTSIKPDFYHPLIKKTGLRWVQRLVYQPHVRKKVLKEYPQFICKYLYKNTINKIYKR